MESLGWIVSIQARRGKRERERERDWIKAKESLTFIFSLAKRNAFDERKERERRRVNATHDAKEYHASKVTLSVSAVFFCSRVNAVAIDRIFFL